MSDSNKNTRSQPPDPPMPDRFCASRRCLTMASARFQQDGQVTPDQFAVLVWEWTRLPTALILWSAEDECWKITTQDTSVYPYPGSQQTPIWQTPDTLCDYRSRWYDASGGRIVEWAQMIDDPEWRQAAQQAGRRPEPRYPAIVPPAEPERIRAEVRKVQEGMEMQTNVTGNLIQSFLEDGG